jgi:hypothetical protein
MIRSRHICFILTMNLAVTCNAYGQAHINKEAETSQQPSDIKLSAIVLPSLEFISNDKIIEQFHKNYFFHREGVDFKTALSDLNECEYYSTFNEPWVRPPTFMPFALNSIGGARTKPSYNRPTLMSAVFGGMVMKPLSRRMHNANMRTCMNFRGYSRYGLTEEINTEIEKNGQEESLLIRAMIASGSKPKVESINQ